MKAILVVDFGEENVDDIELTSIKVHLKRKKNRRYLVGRIKLLPFPEKKRPFGSEWVNEFVEGYNKCLDEILGEEK